MQPSKKFAFDVGITFFASVVTLPLGFIIQTSKSLIICPTFRLTNPAFGWMFW